MPRQRWAVFVHDPDGDMGRGVIVGPFQSAEAADAKAEAIRRECERRTRSHRVAAGYADGAECIVLPVMPGGSGATRIIEEVI